MFKLYSVSIRACNRYQCIPVAATLQYVRIVCFYGLYIPTVTSRQVLRLMYRIYTHIHYIILLGGYSHIALKHYRPYLTFRASVSWLATPLFIFRLFPGLRLCTTLSPWQAVSIYQVSLCPSDAANIQRF